MFANVHPLIFFINVQSLILFFIFEMISREFIIKCADFLIDNGPTIYVSIDGGDAINIYKTKNIEVVAAHFVDRFGGEPTDIAGIGLIISTGALEGITKDDLNPKLGFDFIKAYNEELNQNITIVDREVIYNWLTIMTNDNFKHKNPQTYIDLYHANRNHKVEIYTKESFTVIQKIGFVITIVVIILLLTGFTIYYVKFGKSIGGNTLMFNH